MVPESQYTNPDRDSPYDADPCKSSRESVKRDGRLYERLSRMTGGIEVLFVQMTTQANYGEWVALQLIL